MSKAEIVPKLAAAGGITKKRADDIFSTFVGMISTYLRNGERVALPGLGVFSVVERKARKGRNPRTGVEIRIPARKAVKFSASSALTAVLNAPEKAPQEGASQERGRQTGKEEIRADCSGFSGSAGLLEGRLLPSALKEGFRTFSRGHCPATEVISLVMEGLKHGIGDVRSARRCLLAVILVVLASQHVWAFCFEEAGERYRVSPQLLWAIAKTESNLNPMAVNYNKNGSFDYGLMQVNSSWYKELGRERWMRLGDACYNVQVGAWILSQCVQRYGYTWKAVGCYNAFSKDKRAVYANRVYRVLEAAARRADDCNKGDLVVSSGKKKGLGPD